MFSSTLSHWIASIPGDGIVSELVGTTIQVAKKLSQILDTFTIGFVHIPWETQKHYKEHGRYVSEDSPIILQGFKAALFGAVAAPVTVYVSSHLLFHDL